MDHHQHHNNGVHNTPLSDADLPVEHRGGTGDGLLLNDDHGQHFHGGVSSVGHGDNSGSHSTAHHMMKMYFNFGSNGDPILFEFWKWKSDDVSTILISVVIVFVISFLYEGLKVYREKLFKDSVRTSSISLSNKDQDPANSNGHGPRGPVTQSSTESVRVKILSPPHFYQTFLHMVQVTVSFLLMLIFMTFNVWLCLAVILGAGFGYLVFGWKRSFIGYDVMEHCH